MKGNNELRLNEATMIEALQLWIDSKFVKDAPRVTHIEELGSGGYSREFKVKVTDEREEA